MTMSKKSKFPPFFSSEKEEISRFPCLYFPLYPLCEEWSVGLT